MPYSIPSDTINICLKAPSSNNEASTHCHLDFPIIELQSTLNQWYFAYSSKALDFSVLDISDHICQSFLAFSIEGFHQMEEKIIPQRILLPLINHYH